jgi:hypothetical protein
MTNRLSPEELAEIRENARNARTSPSVHALLIHIDTLEAENAKQELLIAFYLEGLDKSQQQIRILEHALRLCDPPTTIAPNITQYWIQQAEREMEEQK